MKCVFCQDRKASAYIAETRCCINCFVKWKREYGKCCGPGCKNSGSSVKNTIDSKRFCTKCYMRFERKKISDLDVLKSLVNSDENGYKGYEPLQKICDDCTNSVVYKTTERKSNDTVAIKVITVREKATNACVINDEIIFLKKYRHPNIVKFIDSFYLTKEVWIVMEYLPYSLSDIVGKYVFKSGEIAKVCSDVLDGLKYLHAMNIVHRDLKSNNIGITGDGVVKLIDFGCSVLLKRKQPLRRSVTEALSLW